MDFRLIAALWIATVALCGAGFGCAAKPASSALWAPAYAADLSNQKAVESQWWPASGGIEAADGGLRLSPGKRGRFGAFVTSHKFPGSARVEMSVSVPSTTRPAQVSFELHLNADVAVGTNEPGGYVFQFRGRGGSCRLRKGRKTLRSAGGSVRWRSGKCCHVVAERDDGQVSLSVDGKKVLSVRDEEPLAGGALNLVGLTGSRCTLRVERFVVCTRKDRPGDVIGVTAVPPGPRITVTGPVMCARQCYLKRGPYDGCPHLAVFALGGTAKVQREFDDVMEKFYPDKGLDADEAARLLEQFDERLKYYIVPSPLANKDHKEHDYPSRIVSVTGTFFERDGKKWIAASRIEPAKVTYPAKMLAPDRPFVAPDAKPLILKVTDTLTLKCVRLPPGRYLRGSPFYEHPRWQDEYPHEVVLTRPVYISESPVTQAMFEAVVGRNPSKKTPGAWKIARDPAFRERFRHAKPDDGPDFAVENATWAGIQLFCKKLSARNGRTVRVPTEAEWEYAARVGTSSPCFTEKYKDPRSFVADTEGRCEPVKRHKPNAWGLYDMVKSGWELVSDYKLDNVREKQVDPKGPPRRAAANHGSGPLRRTKGGSYYGDTHVNLHGACDEDGNNEEGLMIFRVVVENQGR